MFEAGGFGDKKQKVAYLQDDNEGESQKGCSTRSGASGKRNKPRYNGNDYGRQSKLSKSQGGNLNSLPGANLLPNRERVNAIA